MTHRERIVWVASWIAPLAGWTALVAFATLVIWPQIRRGADEGETHAWIIALVVLLWLVGHLAVRLHGTLSRGFSRDERAELQWKLNVGRGYAHWRDLMRRRGRSPYGGRSHSGERPRYD